MKTKMEYRQQKLINFNEPIREIEMLRRIGLREDEIAYLVWLKTKNARGARWE